MGNPVIVAHRGTVIKDYPIDLITGELLMLRKDDTVYIIAETQENYTLYTGKAAAEIPKEMVSKEEEIRISPK
jgi:hypothetical protein